MSEPAPVTRIPRWLLGLAALGLVGVALWGLRGVLTPIFFAFLIAYFLDPLVDRFEDRGLPRAVGIVVLLFLTLGAMIAFSLLLLPSIIEEIATFVESVPEKVEAVRAEWEPWLVANGVPVPHSFDELWELVGHLSEPAGEEGEAAPSAASEAGAIAERAAPIVQTVGVWIWGRTTSVLGLITSALIVPVFAFYLLHDFDHMVAGIRDLIPFRYRPFVVDVASEIDDVLGQFVRGQLTVMFILAVLYSVAYTIAGVPLAIPIGIIAGLLSFIPYVGGASALVLALLMCALDPGGWFQLIGVVVGYGIIQGLEGFVITPRIVGDKVGLGAVWVLLALMVGGELFGFLGVLLAVPAAAVVKIFVLRAVAYYRKSELFLEGGHPSGALLGIMAEEGLPDDPELAEAKASIVQEEATRAAAADDSESSSAEGDEQPGDEEPDDEAQGDEEQGEQHEPPTAEEE